MAFDYSGMGAWAGAKPLTYADEIARKQAYRASQGSGGQLGRDVADDWARIHGERFTPGGDRGYTGGTGYASGNPAMPTSFAGGPGYGEDPSLTRYNEMLREVQSGQTPLSFGGTPMQPAGMGGGSSANAPYAPYAATNLSGPGGPPLPAQGANSYAGYGAPEAITNPAAGVSLGQVTGDGGFQPGDKGYTPTVAPGGSFGAPAIGAPAIGASAGAGAGTSAAPGTGGGNYPGFDYKDFDFSQWKDPGYDFRLAEGNKLLQGSAAARGNLLSGSTLKDLTNYGQGAASQEYANAYNRFTGNRQFERDRFTGDRAFDYLADVGDRDFAYRAMVGDRDYQTEADRYLTNLGVGATGGTVSSNNAIAALQAVLEQSRGNVGAGGTISGGNAVTNALSQALAEIMRNQNRSGG